MIKPKEAITKLWINKFFNEPRTTEDVKEKSFSEYGCTCSNWSTLIKSCKFLRKQNKKWIQKYNPSTDIRGLFYITGKTPWTDRNDKFVKFLQQLEGDILIVDPYYGLDTFHILTKFPKHNIKFMTSQLGRDEKDEIIKKEISRFKKEFKNIKIRVYPKFYELHDRYIISKNYFVIIGHGLKDLGNKECFLIAIPKKDVQEITKVLEEKFITRWKGSTIIIG